MDFKFIKWPWVSREKYEDAHIQAGYWQTEWMTMQHTLHTVQKQYDAFKILIHRWQDLYVKDTDALREERNFWIAAYEKEKAENEETKAFFNCGRPYDLAKDFADESKLPSVRPTRKGHHTILETVDTVRLDQKTTCGRPAPTGWKK